MANKRNGARRRGGVPRVTFSPEALALAAENKGLSSRQLASILADNMGEDAPNQATVHRWMRPGSRGPQAHILWPLAAAVGLTPRDLVRSAKGARRGKAGAAKRARGGGLT